MKWLNKKDWHFRENTARRKFLTKLRPRAIICHVPNARVVELADSLDSGSSAHSGRAGSSPASRTKTERSSQEGWPFCNPRLTTREWVG